MKVCVLGLRGFPLIEGGVERHCEALYSRMGEDVEVTVFRRKPYVHSLQGYPHIHFVDLPSTQQKGYETVFHSFLATLRAVREKPDVVHIHNIGPALFSGMLRRRGIPMVLTFHSPNYEHAKWGWWTKKLLKYSEKIALANASKIIFVNRFQMEKYPKWIRRKSVYIPNGIQPPIIAAGHDYLDSIGVQPGKYVLAVGRITPEKGFDTLVKGFRGESPAGYKLVIAGGVEFETAYMERLRQLAEDRDDVVFTGAVFGKQLAQLYTHAALYVLSSNNEGFPLVLLEAMSYGLDVLATDIPANHLVELDPEAYFARGDSRTLAAKIGRRLSRPRKPKYDLSHFDWERIVAQTVDIYQKITSGC